ncbi:MAG: hypothetical protein IT371_09130 [Deltaproteobacteria bacterium]|nr:hypothetical protein [Deltaproteobacteria bacterium]
MRQAHLTLARWLGTAAGLLLLGVSSGAGAQRALQDVQAYARANGFPTKVVQCGSPNRPVQRVFVPITPQSWNDFMTRFTSGRGYAALNFDGGSHLAMALQPNDCYLWARNYNGTVPGLGDYRANYMAHRGLGYVFPIDLQGGRLEHLSAWLGARANPNDGLYRGGNCMEWLPNAEVGPGQALFHLLGLKRSRDGRNMKAKLLHAANANVQVVGYHVYDLASFNNLGVNELLGPPPAGGALDAAR